MIPEEFKVIINPLYTLADCWFDQSDHPVSSTSIATELVVSEKESMHVTTEQPFGLETNIHCDHRYEGSKVRFDRNAAVYTIDFIIRMSMMFTPGKYEHYNFRYPSEACWNSVFTVASIY